MAASVKFGLCLVLALSVPSVIEAKGSVKFKGCNRKFMEIHVYHPNMSRQVFRPFSQMRADKACEPQMFEDKAILRLPLDDAHRCGVTEIHNLRTGLRTYLTKVTIDDDGIHRSFQMKCDVQDKESLNRTRRNVLPAGFQEEEVLEIRPMEKKVQPPQLGVAVRQGGQLVTGELNVNPGTPLQMDVFMDEQSVPIYGLLVSHMLVSDTRSQEETIIFNGCSVDPYLFENFNTVDGDFLSAKFRAFKFPESTYVQFRGTVSVCLDKCRGVECSNGVVGYGRKRRAVAELPADPNKVFEVKLSTYIKVDYQDNKAEELDIKTPLLAAMSESPLSEAAADSNALPPKDASSGLEVAREEIRTFTVVEEMSSASSVPALSLTLVAFCLSLFYFH